MVHEFKLLFHIHLDMFINLEKQRRNDNFACVSLAKILPHYVIILKYDPYCKVNNGKKKFNKLFCPTLPLYYRPTQKK